MRTTPAKLERQSGQRRCAGPLRHRRSAHDMQRPLPGRPWTVICAHGVVKGRRNAAEIKKKRPRQAHEIEQKLGETTEGGMMKERHREEDKGSMEDKLGGA